MLPQILALLVLPSVGQFACAGATEGIDVSSALGSSTLQCLLDNGYSFLVVRVWRSLGQVDPNAVQTIQNAVAAGLWPVDGYIFPCFRCASPRQQVETLLGDLDANATKYDRLWLDVEGPGDYWGSDQTLNTAFIGEMVDELQARGKQVGLYTSRSQWTPITGNSSAFSAFPLWYAHYDNLTSFDDFVPFGGWTQPAVKQFAGDATVCGAQVDKNWKP